MTRLRRRQPTLVQPLRYGEVKELEELAEMIIAGHYPPQGADTIRPWNKKMNKQREIYTKSGALPDPSVRSGVYGRAKNPIALHLNSRDGISSNGGRKDLIGPQTSSIYLTQGDRYEMSGTTEQARHLPAYWIEILGSDSEEAPRRDQTFASADSLREHVWRRYE